LNRLLEAGADSNVTDEVRLLLHSVIWGSTAFFTVLSLVCLYDFTSWGSLFDVYYYLFWFSILSYGWVWGRNGAVPDCLHKFSVSPIPLDFYHINQWLNFFFHRNFLRS
jgi:hypothetical protein